MDQKPKAIEVDFIPGDRVSIGPGDALMIGTVRGVCVREDRTYDVGWWKEGEYRTQWFPAAELKLTEPENA